MSIFSSSLSRLPLKILLNVLVDISENKQQNNCVLQSFLIFFKKTVIRAVFEMPQIKYTYSVYIRNILVYHSFKIILQTYKVGHFTFWISSSLSGTAERNHCNSQASRSNYHGYLHVLKYLLLLLS